MDNNYNTFERLLEFGLGISLARQMINTMNHAIGNMATPGTNGTAVSLQQSAFFAAIDGLQAGPLNEQELDTLVKNGKLTPETLVWRPGMRSWTYARNTSEIYKLFLLNNIAIK